MNPIFKQLPEEIVNYEISSYLDKKTKMKLKYKEIEKCEDISKELLRFTRRYIHKFKLQYGMMYPFMNNNIIVLKYRNVKQLKELCKMNNLKKYSKLKKEELISLLLSI
jgi:hypothetical protein